MVTNVKKQRIITGEAPVEELQRKFSEEVRALLKKVAFEHKCSVNELKWNVNNAGIINVQKMSADEMIEAQAQDTQAERIRDIKKSRGLL